jgi:16S rRNA processing protein RimM
MAAARYQLVARYAKPHGLKGEAIVFVLTRQAEEVFVPGRELTPVDDDGRAVAPPVTVERARPYHRRWLLKFQGIDDRSSLERWPQRVLGIPAAEPEMAGDTPGPLADHEVPGAVVLAAGRVIGRARQVLDVPGGPLLLVDGDGREHLVPYRAPILVATDRVRREITIDPPPGLLEL